jgi:hypothetical protein
MCLNLIYHYTLQVNTNTQTHTLGKWLTAHTETTVINALREYTKTSERVEWGTHTLTFQGRVGDARLGSRHGVPLGGERLDDAWLSGP